MAGDISKKSIKVEGMTCSSCELRIENALKKLPGVIDAKASLSRSSVFVTYDKNKVNLDAIVRAIEKMHYSVSSKTMEGLSGKKTLNKSQLAGIGIVLLSFYLIVNNTVGFNFIPEISQSMGYGLLFIVGLLTSFHCVAMCGGINLAQCISYKYDDTPKGRFSRLKPSFLYNAGRVVSYTFIGGIVGALGSVISFSGAAKGIVSIIAGIFMMVMGLNMLNIFPWLRKFSVRMPKIFGNKVYNNKNQYGPFYVGLLNGLMPCGPLQSMQIYALGTGSFTAGALSMFFFSVGTFPLMFGFGALTSFASGKFTNKLMKASAVLVMILGIVMINRGLSLSGIGIPTAPSGISSIAKIEGDVQVVTTVLEPGSYSPIIVQKGIPVRWTIKAKEGSLNGCNNPVTIPKYNIEKKMVVGDNVIEFTPEEEGNILYTCWMGMISSHIKVVSDISEVTEEDLEELQNTDLYDTDDNAVADDVDIGVARITGDSQEIIITVNEKGYSPAIVVLQKGIQAKIKFDVQQLDYCNAIVMFPEYNGQLDLTDGQIETPYLVPENDFTFRCWLGRLGGYVRIVEDINNVDLEKVKEEVQSFMPAGGFGGFAPACH
ncbi:MAG: heavy metal transporter [Clostridiaceae bacterium]|nr:heavy metal transporter [Clostridiaceae bacterium]